jgi:hypothetical protein
MLSDRTPGEDNECALDRSDQRRRQSLPASPPWLWPFRDRLGQLLGRVWHKVCDRSVVTSNHMASLHHSHCVDTKLLTKLWVASLGPEGLSHTRVPKSLPAHVWSVHSRPEACLNADSHPRPAEAESAVLQDLHVIRVHAQVCKALIENLLGLHCDCTLVL